MARAAGGRRRRHAPGPAGADGRRRGPSPLQLLAYGPAVIAAAFLLAWACEAAQVDIAPRPRGGGRRVRRDPPGVRRRGALRAHRPGRVRDRQPDRREPPAARRSPSRSRPRSRCCPRRWRPAGDGRLVAVEPAQRVELAILGAAAVWALRGVLRGALTLLDSAVLIALYVLYLRRAASAGGESPPPLGVAAELAELPRDERRRWVAGLMLVRRRGDPAHRRPVRRRRARQPARSSASARTCCCSGSSRSRPRRPSSWSRSSC